MYDKVKTASTTSWVISVFLPVTVEHSNGWISAQLSSFICKSPLHIELGFVSQIWSYSLFACLRTGTNKC